MARQRKLSKLIMLALVILIIIILYIFPILQDPKISSKQDKFLAAQRYASDHNDLRLLQLYLVPQILCLSMVRVGSQGDGGKWVCNPSRVSTSGNCVIYSFGVNGDTSFEQEFYDISGKSCKIYCADTGNQPADLFKNFKGTFMQIYVGAEKNKSANRESIHSLMEMFNHQTVDIIKMDIEGAEYEVLYSFLAQPDVNPDQTKVCQIMVEFHSGNISQWFDMFERMKRGGYLIYSQEVNRLYPIYSEFSFMHRACIEKYGLAHSDILE